MRKTKLRTIFLADCQSFYASVEKAANPAIRNKPVVVAGDPARRSGIILAACPLAKKYGVTTAERLGESLSKCPDLVVIQPRMQHYIDVSLQITKIYQSFSDLVEPFSIDEQFIDVTGSLHLYGSAEELAKSIQAKVMNETGIWTRVGISSTKVLAKTSCDNFAKKNKSGIFTLNKEDLPSTLWKLPVSEMYLIGSRMTTHFARMGLFTIGEVANTPLGVLKQKMRLRMGKNSDIQAELYWRIANGIDDSPVTPNTLLNAQKAIGNMMTLPRDYYDACEIEVVLFELVSQVCRRCRSKGVMGSVISVGCQGADFDVPTGFSRQMKMPDPSNLSKYVFEYAKMVFRKHWDRLPVRRIGVSISDLKNDQEYQLTIFDNEKERRIEKITDMIKDKFGETSIFRASSVTKAGQMLTRSGMIGGHVK